MTSGGISDIYHELGNIMWKCVKLLQKEMEMGNDSNKNKFLKK